MWRASVLGVKEVLVHLQSTVVLPVNTCNVPGAEKGNDQKEKLCVYVKVAVYVILTNKAYH